MVQCVLMVCGTAKFRVLTAAFLVGIFLSPALASKPSKKAPEQQPWPELLLDGGRKLTYSATFTSQRDIRGKGGFWSKFGDIVLGQPDFVPLVRPYSIAVDSRGRMIITDPGSHAVHIFDILQHKYKLLDRQDKTRDPMFQPQCVAVDSKDNIYITDSDQGKIFVYDPAGKYRTVFGSIKGEGFFKRPTGIAVDPETQHIYVTDTLRNKIYILGSDGKVIKNFGQHGAGPGEFNLPTEIYIRNGLVVVVDAMNFRLQIFDRDGNFKSSIGNTSAPGLIFRPKGVSIDSEGHIYLVEGEAGRVEVFDQEGRLLYNFGNGTGFGNFQLPAGLFIDGSDRVYLVDSYNRRVQVFQYHASKRGDSGATR